MHFNKKLTRIRSRAIASEAFYKTTASLAGSGNATRKSWKNIAN